MAEGRSNITCGLNSPLRLPRTQTADAPETPCFGEGEEDDGAPAAGGAPLASAAHWPSDPSLSRPCEDTASSAASTVGDGSDAAAVEQARLELRCDGPVESCAATGMPASTRVGPRDFEILRVVGQGAFGKVSGCRAAYVVWALQPGRGGTGASRPRVGIGERWRGLSLETVHLRGRPCEPLCPLINANAHTAHVQTPAHKLMRGHTHTRARAHVSAHRLVHTHTHTCPNRTPRKQVFQVRHRGTGALYAMKVMRKERILERDHGEYIRGERDVLTVRARCGPRRRADAAAARRAAAG
jgi:hypothetical protein